MDIESGLFVLVVGPAGLYRNCGSGFTMSRVDSSWRRETP